MNRDHLNSVVGELRELALRYSLAGDIGVASPQDIARIRISTGAPEVYLQMLSAFSPRGFEIGTVGNGIFIYGASEIEEVQAEYPTLRYLDGVARLVIGGEGLYPILIRSDTERIEQAEFDGMQWSTREVAPDFIRFLKVLCRYIAVWHVYGETRLQRRPKYGEIARDFRVELRELGLWEYVTVWEDLTGLDINIE